MRVQVSDYAGAAGSLATFFIVAWYTSQKLRAAASFGPLPGRSARSNRSGPAITTGPELYCGVPSARTNREIEVKLRVRDIPALVVARLKSLHATDRGRVFEQNTLYDTPNSDLGAQVASCACAPKRPPVHRSLPRAWPARCSHTRSPLRGNSRGTRSVTKPRYKETARTGSPPSSHPNRWHEKLKALGFRPGFRYEKYRTSFRLPGLHMDLDETPVGTFLELEGTPAGDRTSRSCPWILRLATTFKRPIGTSIPPIASARDARPRNMVFDK